MLNVLEDTRESNITPLPLIEREVRRAREYLEKMIARAGASDRPVIEVVAITPEMASMMLLRNPLDENRKLSPIIVERYAADMASGLWQGLNGQTIVVSADGHLNDGQHRLNAIVQAGVTITTMVVFGAGRDTRLTLDQPKVRSSGDYLHMQGVTNANNVASCAKIIMAIRSGVLETNARRVSLISNKGHITKAELHKFAMEHMADIHLAFDELGYDWKTFPAPPSHLAAGLLLLHYATAKWEEPLSFLRSIISGEKLTKTLPAYQVRERLLAEKIARNQTAARNIEAIIRGWNDHRLGSRRTRFVLRGEIPEIVA